MDTSAESADMPPDAGGVVHARIVIRGIVQGVGFRPFIHRLASELELSGEVCNFTGGVSIDIQGPADKCREFERRLIPESPPISVINAVETEALSPETFDGFTIQPSHERAGGPIYVSPDVATCGDCLRELKDPDDRRYMHPFINCTNCGPRYTIIGKMPYDRPNTSMAPFEMCENCRREYEDITDRRYHAQPVACPNCGPSVQLVLDGETLDGSAAIKRTRELLKTGKIVAVKGLGGFHLACDATDADAVETLRRRKFREQKPLAVMVPDIDTAGALAHISDDARELLQSPQTPIVLVRKRLPEGLAHEVAPDSRDYGIMLPYTPIHHILLREGVRLEEIAFTALVMTSGNLSDEPLCIDNEEAIQRLGGIADAFLIHDRDILIGCDDSVVRDSNDGPIFLRRARGYIPFPVQLEQQMQTVLAYGAMKNTTVCLTSGKNAFVSQHLGDLTDAQSLDFFKKITAHLQDIFQASPEILACDLHPDYLSTRHAQQQADELELPLVQSQHHHAHIVSCMAEHDADGPVIGLACDGAGLGEDNTIWGCEVLVSDYEDYERIGHLKYVRLPGGDAAVEQPFRMGMSYLYEIYGSEADELIPSIYPEEIAEKWPMFRQMLQEDINCPKASSAGRLFDAISSLAGVCQHATYEGQPAIMLEGIAERQDNETIGATLVDEDLVMDPSPLVRQAVEAVLEGVEPAVIAGQFHREFAEMLHNAAIQTSEETGIQTVALSGGTFANGILVETLSARLRNSGIEVLLHKSLPPGDACLSLGQALIAHHRTKKD
ncbi:MAG: carbamoyltransferase HypF [Armatimonadota bacterium]